MEHETHPDCTVDEHGLTDCEDHAPVQLPYHHADVPVPDVETIADERDFPAQDESAVLHFAAWWRMIPYWLRIRRGVRMECGAYVTDDSHLDATAPACQACEERNDGREVSAGNDQPIRARWALFR